MQRPARASNKPLPRNIYRREQARSLQTDYQAELLAKTERGIKLLVDTGVVPLSRILAPQKSP
jgi:hypothetical protein